MQINKMKDGFTKGRKVRVNWVLIAARLHLVFKCFLGEDTQISYLQLGLGFQISVKLSLFPW